MNDAITISKEISAEFGKDYAWLRERGLEYIGQLSGNLWTDYNTHDPGVTMLELLCWVITDLGYRMAMPVEDIVAAEKDNEAAMHRQFLSALNIMPTAPVTANDYRKLFIRIDGVRNAWMRKARHSVIADYYHQPPRLRYAFDNEDALPGKEMEFELNGLYNILLDVEESHKNQMPAIIKKVKAVFHHFRNLCEDVVAVTEVPTQEIVVCGEIELEARADPEQVWAEVINAIQLYLSPEIHFYNLEEMLEKQIPSHQIFEGPVFNFSTIPFTGQKANDATVFSKKGFTHDAEVSAAELRSEVRLSDLISLIMKVDGVKLIKSFQLGFCGCDEKDITKINQVLNAGQWLLCVKEGHKPVLCMTNSVINFKKDIIPIELKETEALVKLQKIKDEARRESESKIVEDLLMPQGQYREVKNYETLQAHLPETYGIGPAGLPESASPARKAQAKQLKAYLLFFDQVLANYFAQLSHVNDLLGADSDIKQTYFAGVVNSVPGIADIFPDVGAWEKSVYELIQRAGLDNYPERKNQLLDHLLARFAEQFNEYVFLLHRIYGDDYDHAIIRNKKDFFEDYHNMSAFRADALDYYNQKTPAQQLVNVSGMEKRISRLLGFNHYRREQLSGLPYKIFRKLEADPNSTYTWTIGNTVPAVLTGNDYHFRQVDAYEEMGLASIVGCEPENYRMVPAEDGATVRFELLNSKKQVIARSGNAYPVLPGELVSKKFSNAEAAVNELTVYLRGDFRLEGMYVVEHIILRPDVQRKGEVLDSFLPVCIDTNGEYCHPADPYSFRIAVILPGYSMRLRNMEFRKYAEQLIRLETPAHILPRICFIGIDQMAKFEEVYDRWLKAKIASAQTLAQVPDVLNKEFIDVLETIYTVYDMGQLGDCDDDTEEKNPVILGRTNLGSLEALKDSGPGVKKTDDGGVVTPPTPDV